MQTQAAQAYKSAAPATRTTRSIEYQIMARVTKELVETEKAKDQDFAPFADALQRNRKLWNLFARDLAHPDNGLTNELKARLLYLAKFTNHHTSLAMARQKNADALIEVNLSIMNGLRNAQIPQGKVS
jgi:flagellar protein FlaF